MEDFHSDGGNRIRESVFLKAGKICVNASLKFQKAEDSTEILQYKRKRESLLNVKGDSASDKVAPDPANSPRNRRASRFGDDVDVLDIYVMQH